MRTDSIKIFPCFMDHPPKPEKMERKNLYYQEHGSFESKIIWDSFGYLRAAHWPSGKLYAWELPGILD